jgi:hypothetical protein
MAALECEGPDREHSRSGPFVSIKCRACQSPSILDAGEFDDLAPFLDVVMNEGAELIQE